MDAYRECMGNIRNTIKKIILVGMIGLGAYFAGLRQNPSYKELPPAAQKAVDDTNREVQELLRDAIAKYKRGDLQGAKKDYERAKGLLYRLEKIDPHYRVLEALLEQYKAHFVLLQEALDGLDRIRKDLKELSDSGDPQAFIRKIANTGIYNPYFLDRYGLTIGLEVTQLKQNPEIGRAIWNSYLQVLLEWKMLLQEGHRINQQMISDYSGDRDLTTLEDLKRFAQAFAKQLVVADTMIRNVTGQLAKYQ